MLIVELLSAGGCHQLRACAAIPSHQRHSNQCVSSLLIRYSLHLMLLLLSLLSRSLCDLFLDYGRRTTNNMVQTLGAIDIRSLKILKISPITNKKSEGFV